VKLLRLAGTVVYIGYLVQVGLLMLYLPWSPAWSLILLRLPFPLAAVLDLPALRGAVSAFGLLHLVVVAAELAAAGPWAGTGRSDRAQGQ
jgi:hypothetical protein